MREAKLMLGLRFFFKRHSRRRVREYAIVLLIRNVKLCGRLRVVAVALNSEEISLYPLYVRLGTHSRSRCFAEEKKKCLNSAEKID
jgi:hypothetical protein